MASLIKGEWKKLFQWMFFWFLFLLLLMLNGISVLNKIAIDNEQSHQLESSVEESGSEIVSYETFLNNIDEQAESMKNASLFQDSYFNRKSIEKTQEIYNRLHGIKTEADYPLGLKYIVDYRLTDVFIVLTAAALILRLMLYERTEGLLSLLKPTRNGRGELICAKYLTMVIGMLLITVLFYGTNYCIVHHMDLLGAGDISIQSLYGYIASPFIMSAGDYSLLFFLCKWLAIVAAGSVFFLLCVSCRNQVYAVLSIVVIMLTEILWKLSIEDYSWLSFLRQFNLAAAMDTSAYFKDYINFNFFGIPISSVSAGIFIVIFSSVGSLLLSIKLFIAEASVEARANRLLWHRKGASLSGRVIPSLFRGESKKLFFMQKGLFLLLVLIIVQSVSYGENPFYMNKTESYYYQYSMDLQGEPSKEKTEMIKAEEKRFELQAEELDKQYLRYDKGEISFAVLNYYKSELTPSPMEIEGFEKAKKQYFTVRDKYSDYDNVVYIYQTGWEKLLGSESKNKEILDFIKIFLVLLLAFSGIGTVEKTTSVELLIRSSFKGNKSVWRMKRILCACYAFIAAGLTFVWRPIQIVKYYPLFGIEKDIHSILLFSDIGFPFSIGVFLGMIYFIKGVIAVAAGEVILTLSEKCNQESTVLFLGSIILFVPIALIWFVL